MLENSVWRKYNKENNYRTMLARFCRIGIDELVEDDKVLYGILKAKLTKKELKLFAMDSAQLPNKELSKELNLDAKELEKAKYKLYKKLIQDKVRLSFRESSLTFEV